MKIQRKWIQKRAWSVGTFFLLAVVFLASSGVALASGGPQTGMHSKPQATRLTQVHAPTCSGNICNGLDPYQTHCADSLYSVASNRSGALLVELEWSPICKTNWTQAYWLDSDQPPLDVTIQRLAGPDGGFQFDSYWSDGNAWWVNSNQFYAPHNKAIACVYVSSQSSQDPGLCTQPT